MNNFLKKCVSFLITCTFCIGSVLVVSAQDPFTSLQQDDVEALSQLVGYYLDDVGVITDMVSIGDVIPTYQIQNGDISDVDHVKYYPVFLNNKILGIFTIIKSNGKKAYSFGKDFSDFLNQDFYSQNICIFFEDGKTIISSDEKNIIAEDGAYSSYGKEVEVPVFSRTKIERKNIFEEPANNIKNSRAVTGKVTIYIDIKSQHVTPEKTSNLCWAFSVCHIGDTVTNITGVTPISIAQDYFDSTSPSVYNWGVYTDEIPSIFSKHYDLDTTYKTSPLSFSKVKSNINAEKPIYTEWRAGKNGHAMVLLGYGDDNAICLGDSNIGNWKWLLPGTSNGTDWVYSNGGGNHTWTYTVTLD